MGGRSAAAGGAFMTLSAMVQAIATCRQACGFIRALYALVAGERAAPATKRKQNTNQMFAADSQPPHTFAAEYRRWLEDTSLRLDAEAGSEHNRLLSPHRLTQDRICAVGSLDLPRRPAFFQRAKKKKRRSGGFASRRTPPSRFYALNCAAIRAISRRLSPPVAAFPPVAATAAARQPQYALLDLQPQRACRW